MATWRLLAFMAWMLAVISVQAQDALAPEPLPGDTLLEEAAPAATSGSNLKLDTPRDVVRTIDLRSAIEEALRRNPFEQVRTNQNARIDLQKQDLFEDFWMPNLTLDLTATNQRYDRLYNSTNTPSGSSSSVSPNGAFGISVRDYTIFNWGRDYLRYKNIKQNLNRDHQRLTEARRKLRFSVIEQYFNIVRVKEFMRIRREQLRQSSFIHRIAREKLQLRRVPSSEYYQTRAEYLRAQTEYQQSMFDVGIEDEKMANVLGDDYRPSYRPQEQLKYTPTEITPEDALKHAYDTSPIYRDAKVAYETATRAYEKALKDNLPLPRFSVGMGTYQQQFGSAGNQWTRATDYGHNVEMVAAVNMSWTLIGEGGLFNSRLNKQAYLDKRISEIQFYNAKRAIDVRLRTLLRTIRFLEQKVTIADYQAKNARSNFDSVLDSYTSGHSTFPQIKLALDNWILSDMNLQTVKFEHLQRKLELAEVMGVDDLPGDNFETVASK